MSDLDEISRLQARISELESQLAVTPANGRGDAAQRRPWTALASAFCLVLGCVLAPLAVSSVWVHHMLADTDTYVETVAPIADQPAVQRALADAVTAEIVDNLDVEQLTTQALTTLSEVEDMPPRVAAVLPTLSVPLSSGIESFTRDQVNNALASDRFATVWDEVNRAAHVQVERLLAGEQGGVVSAQDDTITINLRPIIEQVREQMVAGGFTLAENIPTVDRTFTLVQSDAVTQAQTAYRLLDVLGSWLVFVSLGLIAAGVLLARDKWRALARGALGLTCVMILLGVALAIARSVYVTTTPAGVLTPEAAGGVFDILVRFLRTTLRAVAVLGIVVAIAAFLSGRSPQAVQARAGLTRGIAQVRRRGERATGWSTGQVGVWLAAHLRAVRVAVVAAGAVVLLLWTAPTAWVVLWTGLAVLLGLLVVQVVAEPASAAPASAGPGASPATSPAAGGPVTGGPVTGGPVATSVSAHDGGADGRDLDPRPGS